MIESLIQMQGELFEAVQKAKIFPDSKYFVDAIPNKHPQKILEEFLKKRENSDFCLKSFVEKNFIFPKEGKRVDATSDTFIEYIDRMWDFLNRPMKATSPFSTLITLPEPTIVPGGRFRESYYWDNYFIVEGLFAAKKVDKAKEIVKNIAYFLNHYGYVPNGNRIYYLTRSQPPFFSFILARLFQEGFEDEALAYYPLLLREYDYWMKGEELLSSDSPMHQRVVMMEGGEFLNRYYDEANHPRPEAYAEDRATYDKASDKHKDQCFRNIRAACESGWDFSSRWFEDPKELSTIRTTDIIPVDLNVLMYHLELLIAKFADLLKEEENSINFKKRAERRSEAIEKYFWDEKESFYLDYVFSEKVHSKVESLAGVFPLVCEIPSKQQAKKVIQRLQERFFLKGGLVTSLKPSSQQWDYPNGWAPLQYMTYLGVLNYDEKAFAEEIAERFIKTAKNVFGKTGKLVEKYNMESGSYDVQEGEYDLQEGFGWTNAVLKIFHRSFFSDGS